MGEYVMMNGQSVKLGTCEHLMYCTYAESVKIGKSAQMLIGNAEPKEYSKPDGWIYRLVFNDDKWIGNRNPRQAEFQFNGKTVTVIGQRYKLIDGRKVMYTVFSDERDNWVSVDRETVKQYKAACLEQNMKWLSNQLSANPQAEESK